MFFEILHRIEISPVRNRYQSVHGFGQVQYGMKNVYYVYYCFVYMTSECTFHLLIGRGFL